MDRTRRGIHSLKMVVPFVSMLLILMAGCAKPPQTDIDAAKAAIDGAKAAEASEYAKPSLSAAEEAWTALQTELTAQEQKFALFRSYKNASAMAADAKAKGDKAKADANARKEQVKQEVTAQMAAASTALMEAKDLLAKAPRTKDSKEAVAMMEGDLQGAESSIAEAQNLFNSGKFLQAQARLSAATAKINEAKTNVEAAMAAKGMKH